MIWVYLCLTIPSLAVVSKYFGWPGLIAYLVLTASFLRLLRTATATQLIRRSIPDELADWLALATLVTVVGAFVALYPGAKTGAYGPGSDSDDSVNVAVRGLLHGRYPYYARTYLGNEVHEMPGMLLLYTPFVLLGNSAYSNLFWLALFLFVCQEELRDSRQSLLLFWMLLALSPVVMQQVVTGGNHLTNGLFTMVSLWWMVRRDHPVAAVVFGLSISSRANFLLLIPLAFFHLLRRYGSPRALRDMAIASATFLTVTLPFYIYDRAHFTPLDAADRLTSFDAILPHLGILIGVAGVLLTFYLAMKPKSLFADCALSQAFFVVLGSVLAWDLTYASYGVFFLPLGILPAWEHSFLSFPQR